MTKEYIISEKHDSMAVREYIREVLGYSSRALKELKYKGKILVDGKSVYVNYILKSNTKLILEFPETSSENIEPQELPLDILYEDDDYLAVNKPSNMPVHPSLYHYTGTLANAVMYYYRERDFVFRVMTRLDVDTTGVVIIAKNKLSARDFQKTACKKEYLAVCTGQFLNIKGKIDAPIGRDEGIIKRKIRQDGKKALTHYEVIEQRQGLSLVKVQPITGRTHQIRLHMSHIGCALYGDYMYGEQVQGKRTMLHCERVSFYHKGLDKEITIKAKLPEDMAEIIKK